MIKANFYLRNVLAVAIILAGFMCSVCAQNNQTQPKTTYTQDAGVVINGVKWATRNVDAAGTFAATPESAGMFYQWNRKKAWNSTDDKVTGWDSSKSKGTTWATANNLSPAGWRVPTYEELETLIDETKVTSAWTTQNGVTGRKFTDRTTGASIFLPAAGYRNYSNGTLNYRGFYGYYWSSTVNNASDAHYMYFSSAGQTTYSDAYKSHGLSVRCVAK
jgi:Fibrobacter succinogenes major domain (Fib_succ_major).